MNVLAEPIPQEIIAKLSGFPLALVIVAFMAMICWIIWAVFH